MKGEQGLREVFRTTFNSVSRSPRGRLSHERHKDDELAIIVPFIILYMVM